MSSDPVPKENKTSKKEDKKAKKEKTSEAKPVELSATTIRFYLNAKNELENQKVALIAAFTKAEIAVIKDNKEVDALVLQYPAVKLESAVYFGGNTIVRFLLLKANQLPPSASLEELFQLEENALTHALASDDKAGLVALLTRLESNKSLDEASYLPFFFYGKLTKALSLVKSEGVTFAYLSDKLSKVASSPEVKASEVILTGKSGKAAKVEAPAAPVTPLPPVNKAVIGEVDWSSAGLISSLKIVFSAAIVEAFPQSKELNVDAAVITRCNNPTFGDFQCNNAMALGKALKTAPGYTGPTSPKDVAERIIQALPVNPIVESCSAAPNGFINIKVATSTLVNSISNVVNLGVQPPVVPFKRVLVDFSSPNIAKEMHVGHLRSTIIGDCISRLLEFCKFEVLRVNHVGDWGTQFGMLITYLLDAYPDILENPPNISDLTALYKASKKRFDEDEQFKERSRNNVVNLQSHDPLCKKIWQLLCDISRQEFQKVYNALDVTLEEFGESFYNPMIPTVIEELKGLGMVHEDEGMLIVKLPHFTIPLILRKSDGGYGYDSTDMAALNYRLFTLKRDWIIIITDAGQANHFYMCFDAGKEAGWLDRAAENRVSNGEERTAPRLDHIGFGVVCGDDGKRFKTRSSETVRLIDLLNASRDRMKESLQSRAEEGKTPLTESELDEAAAKIGYGAVKYFDLKQHPSTDYIFNYDRMLDTKGDTAVYLMFAYARVASILRKAKEERNIDITSFQSQANALVVLEHPAERALAFELLQFGDMIKSVINELLPNRLCDYLKEVSVKFTDFVTKCHVLNAEEKLMQSRLLLCEASRQVMSKCFFLLGITPLERI